MGVIKIGDTVKMKNGGDAKILAEFGAGGQGTVYKVSYNGKDYALKWYHVGAFKGKEKGGMSFFYVKAAAVYNFRQAF